MVEIDLKRLTEIFKIDLRILVDYLNKIGVCVKSIPYEKVSDKYLYEIEQMVFEDLYEPIEDITYPTHKFLDSLRIRSQIECEYKRINNIERNIIKLFQETPDLSPETLSKYAKNSSDEIRKTIASHPNTSKDDLLSLADKFPAEVVCNKNVTSEFLNTLILKKVSPSYLYIANSSKASPITLSMLAMLDDERVHGAIARNSNAPTFILNEYATSQYIEKYNIKEGLAHNLNTPVNILRILANDKNYTIRDILSKRQYTPIEILRILAADEMHIIREDMAENPNIPIEILEILAKDPEPSVKIRVAKNPNVTIKILEILIEQTKDLLSNSTSYDNNYAQIIIRKLVVENNKTTPELLNKIAYLDGHLSVAQAIVLNPKTPIETIIDLYSNCECWEATVDLLYSITLDSRMPIEIVDKINEKMQKYEKQQYQELLESTPEDFDDYGHHYGEFEGTYAQDQKGISDDVINDAFEGDPDAYWNID